MVKMAFLAIWRYFLFLLCLSLGLAASDRTTSSEPPTATLSSGKGDKSSIFVGRSLPEFDQDVFLGIKFADEPVRFTPAQLKTSYKSNDSDSGSYDVSGTTLQPRSDVTYYNATEYGYDCPGYGSDTTEIVDLGSLAIGYNMSYIIQQSAENDKPVLGVSINYRLAAFGFLDSKEVRAEGNTNLALRDQRVAMHWVKQHIEAFGGDPEKITIWGESAGAYSVGDQLVTNGGDNEGLFRAAIMDSGNAVGPPYNGTEWHQPMYDGIVERAGCSNATNTLECLRNLSYEEFNDVAYHGLEWFATIDNIFLSEYPQISYREGRLAKVPLLLGTNTDEGTSFGTTGVNTDEEAIAQLISSKRWVLSTDEATRILSLYPNISAIGCPYGWGNVTWPALGYEYKRYESIAGDLCMVAPRRMLAHTMAGFDQAIFSYRWDVAAFNDSTLIGVQHFADIPFVFANPVQNITTLEASLPGRLPLGQMAARMWTSFAADLNPNGHGISNIPEWPDFARNATNFVFRLPRNESYIELDDYRTAGMDYINSIAR
ncbi:Triacylglycerol lipase (LipA) [Penicillium herquei]|nr:Triacylglycerol lipase (LipA) [Penicillium herquei]